jgi:hypothetical protein
MMTFKVIAATLAAIVVTLGLAGAQTELPSAGVVREISRQPLPEKPGTDVVVITIRPVALRPRMNIPGSSTPMFWKEP